MSVIIMSISKLNRIILQEIFKHTGASLLRKKLATNKSILTQKYRKPQITGKI